MAQGDTDSASSRLSTVFNNKLNSNLVWQREAKDRAISPGEICLNLQSLISEESEEEAASC